MRDGVGDCRRIIRIRNTDLEFVGGRETAEIRGRDQDRQRADNVITRCAEESS